MALKGSENSSVLSDKISGPRILATSNDSPRRICKTNQNTLLITMKILNLKSLAYKGEGTRY